VFLNSRIVAYIPLHVRLLQDVFEGEAAHATALQLAKEHVIEVSRWQDIVWELPSVIADVPADARCLYRWPVERSAERGFR
jgi:hypothetical protein